MDQNNNGAIKLLTPLKKSLRFSVGNCVLLTFTHVPPQEHFKPPQTPWLTRLGGFFTEIAMYGKKPMKPAKKPTPGKYGPKK